MIDKKRCVNTVLPVVPYGILYSYQSLGVSLGAVALPVVSQRLGNHTGGIRELKIEETVYTAGIILCVYIHAVPALPYHIGIGINEFHIIVHPGQNFHVLAGIIAVKMLYGV